MKQEKVTNEVVEEVKDEKVVVECEGGNNSLDERVHNIEEEQNRRLCELIEVDARMKEICPDIEDKIVQAVELAMIGHKSGQKKMIKRGIRFFEFLEDVNIVRYGASDVLKEFFGKNTSGKTKKMRKIEVSVGVRDGLTKEEFFKLVGQQLDYQFKRENAPEHVIKNKEYFIEQAWQQYYGENKAKKEEK